jgi:uncharacterized membrane protein
MNMSRLLRYFALCAALLVALGCGDEADNNDHDHATQTGAICPPSGSALRYQTFGQGFMSSYCTRCHSSTVTGASRQSAPVGIDFDTLAGIRAHLAAIDAHAAAGPNAVNALMPPSGQSPTNAERTQLGEWLACGAPE